MVNSIIPKKDVLEKIRKEKRRIIGNLKGKVKRLVNDLTDVQIQQIKKDTRDTFYKEIQKKFKSPEFIDAVVTVVSNIVYQMQETYWGGSGDIVLQEDPTQLIHKEHLEAIQNEVIRNTKNIIIDPTSGVGSFEAVSDGFIVGGNTDKGSPTNIPWLQYFIYGHISGNLIWVNKDVYEVFKGDTAGSLGRFGNGYLWHLWNDEKKYRQAQLKNSGLNIDLSDLKHGQSGKQGRDWFGNVMGSLDLNSLVIQPARASTISKIEAKWSKKLGQIYKVTLK